MTTHMRTIHLTDDNWADYLSHTYLEALLRANTAKLRHSRRVVVAVELEQQMRGHPGRQVPVPTFEGTDKLFDVPVVLPGGDVGGGLVADVLETAEDG